MRWLTNATKPGGWYSGRVAVENIVFDGVGHEMSPDMVHEVHRFIIDTLVQTSDFATIGDYKI